MKAAYDEIKPSGRSGYDGKYMMKKMKDYEDLKRTAFERWSKAQEEARKKIQERDEAIRAACRQWTEECSRRITNEVSKPSEALSSSASADRQLLEGEEKEIVAQAVTRSIAMNEYLASGMKRIEDRFRQEADAIAKELDALRATRENKAPRPPYDRFPTFFIASQSRQYDAVTSSQPGEVTGQNFAPYTDLEPWRDQLAKGLAVAKELVAKEEQLHKRLDQAVDLLWAAYDQLAPDNMPWRAKQKPTLWGSDPNRYYGERVSFYTGGFSHGQIDIRGVALEFRLPPKTMPGELRWFQEFLDAYDRDMPVVERFLADDARGLKVERLGSALIDELNEFNFSGDWDKERVTARKRFTFKNGQPSPGVDPGQSDGALYLQQMRNVWTQAEGKHKEVMAALQQPTRSKLFYNFKNPYLYRPALEKMGKIPDKIKLYEEVLAELSGTGGGQDGAAIRELYDRFRDAYEARDDGRVMSCMGDSWEAGDGTTLADLQGNLRKSFGIFDEIKYSLQNLTVRHLKEKTYGVSYDVTITSRIFDGNIKHEEKSSVSEEVTVGASGKPRITRTLQGRFWYVE
jgi:hypothetical protein